MRSHNVTARDDEGCSLLGAGLSGPCLRGGKRSLAAHLGSDDAGASQTQMRYFDLPHSVEQQRDIRGLAAGGHCALHES